MTAPPPHPAASRRPAPVRGAVAALALAVLLAGTALPPPAGAADPAPPIAVQLNGASRPGLSRAAVEALPAKEITVAFQTEKGEERARYTGALLWDALAAAGLVATQGKHPELHQFAVITGSDGYFVVVSLGEIAPDFGAVPMLLAYARDGAPLPPEQGLRLVVPGDSRGARSVRTLARLDILTLGATP